MRFFTFAFQSAPDDLESSVGFAGSRCHYEQQAVLPLCDGLDSSIHRVHLVVAWGLAVSGVVVVLQYG